MILARHRFRPAELVFWALAVAAFFVFPEDLAIATSVLVMIILVLSYDLLLGFAGVLSFGHAVFFGLGAYVAGWLSLAGWTEPISGVLAAGAAAALLAAVVGPFVLRLTGLPLLMVTLALGVLAFGSRTRRIAVTGGDDDAGITIAPRRAHLPPARAGRRAMSTPSSGWSSSSTAFAESSRRRSASRCKGFARTRRACD